MLEFDGAVSSGGTVGPVDVAGVDVVTIVVVVSALVWVAGGPDDEAAVVLVHSGEPVVVAVASHPFGFGVDEHAEAYATTQMSVANPYPLHFPSLRCVGDSSRRAPKAKLCVSLNADFMSCVYGATQFSTIVFQMASAVTLEPCWLGWMPSDV